MKKYGDNRIIGIVWLKFMSRCHLPRNHKLKNSHNKWNSQLSIVNIWLCIWIVAYSLAMPNEFVMTFEDLLFESMCGLKIYQEYRSKDSIELFIGLALSTAKRISCKQNPFTHKEFHIFNNLNAWVFLKYWNLITNLILTVKRKF